MKLIKKLYILQVFFKLSIALKGRFYSIIKTINKPINLLQQLKVKNNKYFSYNTYKCYSVILGMD